MFRKILFLILFLVLAVNCHAWQQTVGSSVFEQTTDKFTMNKPFTAPFKVLSLSSSCTIGVDCDGTSIEVTHNGFILATAAITVTLPEIVASPSATQVPVGASLCLW